MSRRTWAWVLVALAVSALLRWPLLTRQGLWVDEVFSLALATGHSLEHPAAEAEPALGDFVEGAAARPAREWRAYLAHDEPPAGPGRVVRAVLLSDTSPPLYYLALSVWTRVVGTSDRALRGFSLACALLCVPFLAGLARWAGGARAVLPACGLYAFTPLALYYGTEGRMYALLWLCVLAFAWQTARLGAAPRAWRAALWSATAAAGFLTHYFFAFVWAAVLGVAFLRASRATRRALLLGVVVTGLAILPWYLHIGESLGRWRVTQDWLTWRPDGFARGVAARELFLSFFTGAELSLWGEDRRARALALLFFAGLAAYLFALRRGRAFAPRRLVLWAWLAAAWAGPLVFDALRGTYTVAVSRYALAGLPAAILLAGVALAPLRTWAQLALLAALGLAWTPHFELLWYKRSRSWCPLREVAQALDGATDARSIVLAHSVPSGVLGLARYSEGPAPIAAWVEQLGERRVPESLRALAQDKEQVHLVRLHEVGAPCPLEDWLRREARLDWEGKRESVRILHFAPREGGRF